MSCGQCSSCNGGGNQNLSASFCGGSGSTDLGVSVMCYCGEKATLRTARTLKNKGKKFWGCPKYKSGSDQCGGCNYFKWFTDNEIEEKGWSSQKIEGMGGGKLKIEEMGCDGKLSIKNVEEMGCGGKKNAEKAAAVRSVVAEEMEKCMKSIENTAAVRSVVAEEMEKCMKSIENRLTMLTVVVGVLCVLNIIVVYVLVTKA
ncbi:uncharacterized protein LOC114189301 [Vigna unguiculata]|uniref:uncharacterized protein LOC114189301 n=1 Tax=Vigna unguiculata TaxID=3917 RepID=UPI001016208D|nr:uncharacterized protein LOC114189301 [Vigna unguiculata]